MSELPINKSQAAGVSVSQCGDGSAGIFVAQRCGSSEQLGLTTQHSLQINVFDSGPSEQRSRRDKLSPADPGEVAEWLKAAVC